MSNRDNPGVHQTPPSHLPQSGGPAPAIKLEKEDSVLPPPSTLTGPGLPGSHIRERSAAPLSLLPDQANFVPVFDSGISYNHPLAPPPPGISAEVWSSRALVASTPSDSGLTYVTDHPASSPIKEEAMDTNLDSLPGDARLSTTPSLRTSEHLSQPDEQFVGSVDHTTFEDIRPPQWGELRAGGDAMNQKFLADMYKFMYISNRSTIQASHAFDAHSKTIERLERLVQQAREEATDAQREVRRLTSDSASMQKTISSMSEEIKLIARCAHDSISPSRGSPLFRPSRPPPVPPKPAPPRTILDEDLATTVPYGGPSCSQTRTADGGPIPDPPADVPVPQNNWSVVASRGARKGAKGTVQMTPANPAPPKPRVIDDSQLWILRFNGNPPARKMSPAQMHTAVNSLDKCDWAFDVVSANWSQSGNGNCIMLRFTTQTTEQAIDIHHAKILARLSHGIAGATLTRNVQWSKVVVMNVPCRKIRVQPLGEDASEEDQPMHENEEIESYWTPEDLDNQMKINPLYQRLHVTQKPNWTSAADGIMGRTHANISFSFEDPNGEYTADLFTRPMYIFNERCPMRVWKEKVHVLQCDRCWKLGPSHVDCNRKCRCCASTGHLEGIHQIHCAVCEKEGWISKGKACIHYGCANCNANHAADDGNCQARAKYVRIQRNRNVERYQKPSGSLGRAQAHR